MSVQRVGILTSALACSLACSPLPELGSGATNSEDLTGLAARSATGDSDLEAYKRAVENGLESLDVDLFPTDPVVTEKLVGVWKQAEAAGHWNIGHVRNEAQSTASLWLDVAVKESEKVVATDWVRLQLHLGYRADVPDAMSIGPLGHPHVNLWPHAWSEVCLFNSSPTISLSPEIDEFWADDSLFFTVVPRADPLQSILMPAIVMHELGHTRGLDDEYFAAPRYQQHVDHYKRLRALGVAPYYALSDLEISLQAWQQDGASPLFYQDSNLMNEHSTELISFGPDLFLTPWQVQAWKVAAAQK